MHRVDNASSADTMPDVGPVGPNPNGFFQDRNSQLGQPGTTLDSSWLNTLQEELCNVVTGAGLTLSKSSRTQLFTAIQTLISASVDGVSPTVIKPITQNGHGYVKGQILYFNGSTWLKAKGDSINTSWTVGMVYAVQSTNVFKLLLLGYIDGLSGLTAGVTYFLSTSTAGGMQNASPVTDGYVRKPVFIADSATSGYFFNFNPTVVGSGDSTDGILLAVNNLSDLDDAADARDNLGLGTAAVAASADFIAASELSSLATVDYVDTTADTLQTDIDNLTTSLAAGLVDIEDLQTDVATLDTNVSGLLTDVDGVQSDITSINTALNGKQPLDATLTAFAGLTFSANKYLYSTGADTFALGTITAFIRGLLDDADAATARTTLGLGTAAVADAGDFIAISELDNLATKTYVDDSITAGGFATTDYVDDGIAAAIADLATETYVDDAIADLATEAYVDAAVADLATESYVDTSISTAVADLAAESYVDAAIATRQPLDATLTALAALTFSANTYMYATGADAFSVATITAFARGILDDVDAAATRTTLGLGSAALSATSDFIPAATLASLATISYVDTNYLSIDDAEATYATITYAAATYQPLDSTLTAFAALSVVSDSLAYGTGTNTFALTTLTAFARGLLDDADAAAMRTTLGLGTAAVAASSDFIPAATLATLATITYVDAAIADFATEDYVTTSIDDALTGFATEIYVNDALDDYATISYVDGAVAGSQPLSTVLTELTALVDPSDTQIVFWNDATNNFEFLTLSADFEIVAGELTFTGSGGGGLTAVEDDTDPHLGGNLVLNGYNVTGTGNITITGNIQATDSTLGIRSNAGSSKELVLLCGTGATSSTATVITSAQTANRTITLPDATTTLVGIDVSQTLTNKTLTSPKVGTSINDTNGNEIIITPATASAVNEITITNAATGGAPIISASGGDSNIDLLVCGKGTGYFGVVNPSDSSDKLMFRTSGASFTTSIQPTSSANRLLYLPDNSGTIALLSDIAGGGITAVVQDTDPHLGGNLVLNEYNVVGTGNIIITGNIQAQDSTLGIRVNAGSSKELVLLCSTGATSSTSTTISSAQTANRVVTLPDATDTLVGKATTDVLTNKTVTNCKETVATPTVTAGAVTISLANGTMQKVVTAANTTITLPSAVAGTSYTILVEYGGTHTITWAGGGTIRWAGGTAPVATSVNGQCDIYVFVCHGTASDTFGSDGGRNY